MASSIAPLKSQSVQPPACSNHVVRGPHRYTQEVRRLANVARKMAVGRAVLYHATRYPTAILRTGVIFTSEPGLPKVSFTRSPEVAAYWALRERPNDEGRGAILLFDRGLLQSRYQITPVHEQWVKVNGSHWHDEAEEEVWTDIIDVSRYLIGHVSTDYGDYSDKVRRLNRQLMSTVEARLDQTLLCTPDWRTKGRRRKTKSSLERSEVARKALRDGISVEQVAKDFHLKMGRVRRLAGKMRRPDPFNRQLAEIAVAIYSQSGQCDKLLASYRAKGMISTKSIARALGEDNMHRLRMYSGLSRREMLDTIHGALPELLDGMTKPDKAVDHYPWLQQ